MDMDFDNEESSYGPRVWERNFPAIWHPGLAVICCIRIWKIKIKGKNSWIGNENKIMLRNHCDAELEKAGQSYSWGEAKNLSALLARWCNVKSEAIFMLVSSFSMARWGLEECDNMINTPELLDRRDIGEWNSCFTGRYFADTSTRRQIRWSLQKSFFCVLKR
jgi:hypothetical protein